VTAYSFKPMFAPRILDGTKRQTIRADRKRHARPGEQMQLYTGMRTKQCKLITRVTCESVQPIRLSFSGRGGSAIIAGGTGLEIIENLEEFARSDGFENWIAMRNFWWHEHGAFNGFEGVLITWRPIA
jgi:hypothetical protein